MIIIKKENKEAFINREMRRFETIKCRQLVSHTYIKALGYMSYL
jgi:hypothetical protein